MKTLLPAALLLSFSQLALAQTETTPVPLIKDFGPYTLVDGAEPIDKNGEYKVIFNVARAAKAGELNHAMDSLARFLNMQVASGVKPENMQLALVVRGPASEELLADKFFQARHKVANKNQPLIEQLLANNVKVYVCGQSASYFKVDNNNLIPGVKLALSAMAVNAQLQQQGYTLNPF